eukprot:CAMPEP_0197072568 /NCGR_PEP_ID=MMETSP1384-20130603/210162_1 /TAXON_ID=29189 /ORGANISM="Ammonia sp." /LENGTH=470 /DNA_ID=CAMNT_0042511389 /DNA_START=32 /DNA_END=1448 /DNA_ORIENTATION=+
MAGPKGPMMMTMSKSVSFSNTPEDVVSSIPTSVTLSQSTSSLQHLANEQKESNEDKKRRRRRGAKRKARAQTNTFMSSVNVGQTVRLTKHRIGFIRYKGKVKFALGVWYGLEIFDSLTTTRHNGTVFGKRYFNCPREKGLFVKREIIVETIKPQNLKKALKQLEQKQIQLQNEEEKKKKLEQEKRAAIKQRIEHNKNQNSILALYQSQVYGNHKLALQLEKDDSNSAANKIKKDFKRFERLSFMAANNKEIQSMIRQDAEGDVVFNGDGDGDQDDGNNDDDDGGDGGDEEESKGDADDGRDAHKGIDIDDNDKEESKGDGDGDQDDGNNDDDDNDKEESKGDADDGRDAHKGIDIDEEAWSSKKEREILELLDDESNDANTCNVRLFYPLNLYISEYEYVFNKGLLVKRVNNVSKQGRSLILECGVQGNGSWYIQAIHEENIKKFSKEAVDEILQKLLPDYGYEIMLKQE